MPVQPDADEFKEWQGHPVTEWVLGLMKAHAENQKLKWAELAWNDGVVDQLALTEAKVRADCYLAIPESAFEDWKAIDDTEA